MRAALFRNPAVLPLLAILPVVVSGSDHECYVCIPTEQQPAELQRQFPGEELTQCGAGLPPIKKCPDNYHGCLTQYNNGRLTRSCGELNITTCNMANGVYYCYCKGRHCNGPENDQRPPPPAKNKDGGGGVGGEEPPPDDEDTLPGEGSGVGGGDDSVGSATKVTTTHQPPKGGLQKKAANSASHLIPATTVIGAVFILLL